MRTNINPWGGMNCVYCLKKLVGFFALLLSFSVTIVYSSSKAYAAPGCAGAPSADTGTFAGLTQQQGGFGNPNGIIPFLEGKGLINPTRVDKVDGLQGNTNCQNGEENVVSAINSGNNNTGNWFSDQPICAIAVHAGGGQTVAVYIYDPAVTKGAWTTAKNTNPQGTPQAISNMQFFTCSGTPPNDQAFIRLKKTTDGPAPQAGNVGINTFTLKLTRTSDNQMFSQDISVTGYDMSDPDNAKFTLVPGEYVFTEILPPVVQNIPNNSQWLQDSLVCTLTDDQGGGTTIQSGITVNLGANDTVTCTATNNLEVLQNPIGEGRIIIRKSAAGVKNPVLFDFTWVVDNGEGLLNPNQLFNNNANNVVVFDQGNLRVGQYIIREEALNGWNLSSISCNDNNSSGNTGSRQATINLEDDETVICTFVNLTENDDPMMDVVKKFIKRRVDNLLSHDPDRSRIQRRLDQQRQGSLKDTKPMKLSGDFANGSFKDFKEVNMKFSTSLSQLRAAAVAEEVKKLRAAQEEGFVLGFGTERQAESLFLNPQRFDIWAEGHISHYKDSEGGFTSDGDFGILYVGADYAINEWLLIGALVQFDWTKEDIEGTDLFGEIEGDGWMVGPYVGMKLSDQVYFNARAAWGESDNEVVLTDSVFGTRRGSFKTDRWLASAELIGNWYYKHLKIAPSVKLSYGNENQDSFLNSLGLLVGSSVITIGRLTFGPEFSYTHETKDGTIIQPHLSIEGIWNFDQDDIILSNGDNLDYDELRGKVEAGVIVNLPSGRSFRLIGNYDGIGDSDLESYGGQMWFNFPLN